MRVIRRHALPGQQEAQEVARRDRLDLGAQALDRVVMNARQQPALAPFVRGGAGREAPAHGEAFGFERRQRGGDRRRREAEGRCKHRLACRALPFQAPAHDLDQRLVGRPVMAACAAGP